MQGFQVTVLGECVADAFPAPGEPPAPGASPAPGGLPGAGASARPGLPGAGGYAGPGGGLAAGSPVGRAPGGQAAGDELTLRVLPGGGPANTAVALGRLGTDVRFLGRLSDDAFGRLFRGHLSGSGVDLRDCPRAAEPSTLALAALDEQGQAAWSFHAEGTADWQWTAAELAAVDLDGTACVHAGSLTLVRAPGAAPVEDFLVRAGRGATICLDPNVRPLLVPPDHYRARLPRWCALADILRVSEDDLALLRPGATPADACDAWHAAGARLVVVTLGARGALVSVDGERATVPGVPVTVVDTVAAGDSFTAGLLHRLGGKGLLGGRLDTVTLADAAEAAAFAAQVAALTCSVPGPNPPWADQLAGTAGQPAR